MWCEAAGILAVVAVLLFLLLVVPYFTRPDMIAYMCSVGGLHEGAKVDWVTVTADDAAAWFVDLIGEHNALTPGEFADMLRRFGSIRGKHNNGYEYVQVEGFTLNGVKRL